MCEDEWSKIFAPWKYSSSNWGWLLRHFSMKKLGKCLRQNSLNSRSKATNRLLPIFLQREQSGLGYFHTFFLVFNTGKSQKHKDHGTRILLVKHLAVYFSHFLLLYITGSYFLAFSGCHKKPFLKSDSALFLPSLCFGDRKKKMVCSELS